MSRKSTEKNGSNVNRWEYYNYILSELLSKKDDSFSEGFVKDVPDKSQIIGKDGHDSNKAFPLFDEQINCILKDDKTRLKHTLHEIVTCLNDDVDKVDQDIQAMVESGEIRQDALKELSAGLLQKLSKMAQGVDDLLNIVASKCRPMTTAEKIELGKRIRKLPDEALNRVVEIITRRMPASQSSDKISMNLRELDDANLWRLYYHVEYALNENKI